MLFRNDLLDPHVTVAGTVGLDLRKALYSTGDRDRDGA